MKSRLVVLGSSAAWPEAGRACSGFHRAADGLDALIITHQHPDHMLDGHALYRARAFGRPGAAAVPLYSPPGVVRPAEGVGGARRGWWQRRRERGVCCSLTSGPEMTREQSRQDAAKAYGGEILLASEGTEISLP